MNKLIKCFCLTVILLCSFIGYGQIGSNGNFSDYVKVNPWSDRSNGFIAQSDNSHPSYLSLHNENSAYGVWEIKAPLQSGSNYAIGFRHSSTTTPLFDVLNNGRVGLGIAAPSRMLHLRSSSPQILLELSNQGNAKVEFASGTNAYEVNFGSYAGPGSGQLRVGPIGTGTQRAMYCRSDFTSSSSIAFTSNYIFAMSGQQGLSGSYLFDDQVSTTKLMVSPTSLSPYPSIPTGYLFNVQGDSYLKGKTYQDGLLQINNATDLDPNNANLGLSVGNSINTIAANPPTVLGEIPYTWLQSQESRPLALNPIPNSNPTNANTSYVAIGFVPGNYNVPVGYKLAVKGKIICEELKVKYAGQWSDYVFNKDYKLRELQEVESFIAENKHLPDVPSEMEIKEQGIEAGQMDATLLRKIEELTLYVIDQNKKMGEMKEVINKMDTKIKELEKENKLSK